MNTVRKAIKINFKREQNMKNIFETLMTNAKAHRNFALEHNNYDNFVKGNETVFSLICESFLH